MTLLKLDAHYEKKLLIKFLKTQGFSEVKILDSHMRRNLFWIHSSEWKLVGEMGNKGTFGSHDFDFDIISRIPTGFGDHSMIVASWRERFAEKDFYCCRSGGFVYVCIYHF